MKLMVATALGVLLLVSGNSQADEFTPPEGVKALNPDKMKSTFAGNTALGTSGWKEFYLEDGTIEGRSKKNRHYVGKWIIEPDRMCYEYEKAQWDGCAFIGIDADGVIRYYDVDRGREKGSARVKNGRQL